jgi:hypothetical protein
MPEELRAAYCAFVMPGSWEIVAAGIDDCEPHTILLPFFGLYSVNPLFAVEVL